eukprot:Gb_31493 [translate_table: standard]
MSPKTGGSVYCCCAGELTGTARYVGGRGGIRAGNNARFPTPSKKPALSSNHIYTQAVYNNIPTLRLWNNIERESCQGTSRPSRRVLGGRPAGLADRIQRNKTVFGLSTCNLQVTTISLCLSARDGFPAQPRSDREGTGIGMNEWIMWELSRSPIHVASDNDMPAGRRLAVLERSRGVGIVRVDACRTRGHEDERRPTSFERLTVSVSVSVCGEQGFGRKEKIGRDNDRPPGKKKSYQAAAVELGKELLTRNIDLVYGGGSVGLMGLVSQAVHNGGGHVLGIIPKTLMCREITGETVGEVKAVGDMHQRKAEMARQSDAFIALPGGYGTLEELLEVITWAQLGIHDKPVGLLNVDGYYNSLLSFIDKAVDDGFIKPAARHIIVSAPTAKELVRKLEEYVPRHDGVASKLSWEMEQLGYSSIHSDIAR